MLYTSDQRTEMALVRVLRKPFTGPQDSAVGDQLISLIEVDILAQAAHRLADQLEVLVTELESRQASLDSELAEAQAAAEQAELQQARAEQTFISSFAQAAAVGQPVGENTFVGRQQIQNAAQAVRGHLQALVQQSRQVNNRHGLLAELVNELREFSPPSPADIQAVIENSRFWKG